MCPHGRFNQGVVNLTIPCAYYEVCKIGESNRKVEDLLRKVGKPMMKKAKDLGCLYELIHYVGENTMNYIVAYKLLQYNLHMV